MLWLLLPVCVGVCLMLLTVLALTDCDLMLTWRDKLGTRPESLRGQVVWITGASSGIGEHTACRLAQAGCKLVLSARRKSELERVKAACLVSGEGVLTDSDVFVLPLDMLDFDTHKEAVSSVLDHFQQIDVLVNNAGRSQRSPWVEVELAVDRELFELNVMGPVSLTQHVLPYMLERGQGHIVCISSIAGKMGLPESRSYNGSKYALHGFFECLRTEMGEENVDVSLICPGPVFSNATLTAAKGKEGEMVGRAMLETEKRISTARCAHLVAVAIANRQYEAWIALHPWLGLLYVSQHFPDLGRWIFLRFSTRYLMKLREGK